MKAFTKLLTSLEKNIFDIKFATLWPLTDSLAMCWERLRLWFSVTPKSTTSRTTGKRLLWIEYSTSDDWFKLKIQHLLSEIGSCQVCDHSAILFKPSWNESGFVQIFEYSLTSSAKSFTHVSPENKSLISFINTINSNGPRQLPCTTPLASICYATCCKARCTTKTRQTNRSVWSVYFTGGVDALHQLGVDVRRQLGSVLGWFRRCQTPYIHTHNFWHSWNYIPLASICCIDMSIYVHTTSQL